jgi:ABC-2 type transport system permease protein
MTAIPEQAARADRPAGLARPAVRGRDAARGAAGGLVAVELRKQSLRLRTYVAFGLMVVIPVVITVVIKVHPGRVGSGNRDFFAVATYSGLNIPLAALTAMSRLLLVIVVSLFAGETVSGEASWGTLRYLLVRPVPRSRLLLAKLAVAGVLSLFATAILAVAALLAGIAAFGWHPVLTLSLSTVAQGPALLRLFLATLYVAGSMAAFVGFALLVSTLTDSAFGAVAAGVGLGVISQILDGVTPLGMVRYGLPTHYLDAWHGLFAFPVSTADMVRGILVQLGYGAFFVAVAWWWFRRKDVTS